MAVRYGPAADCPELVSAQVTEYRTEAEHDYVRRSEVVLVARWERLTLAELYARTEAMANSRSIRRVAMIQEPG
jgi:hypothetical protein